MYGVNWVTIFGKVLTEPQPVRFGMSHGIAYLVDGSYKPSVGDQRGVCIWCYSFAFWGHTAAEYDLHVGDCVVMHGSLFAPTKELLDQVGETRWALALNGDPVAAVENPKFKGVRHNNTLAVMTGRVQPPGALEYVGYRSQKPFIQFGIKHEADIWADGKWQHRVAQLKCCYHILDGTESVVVPGAVLLLRGELSHWGTFIIMLCDQIESLGVIVRDFANRDDFVTEAVTSGRKPRWRAAARKAKFEAIRAEREAEKAAMKAQKKLAKSELKI